MDIQHFRVKLFATAESRPHLGDAIAVFHRWIQERRLPETMIDVSDYEHVPSGPGIILVCHEAIYGLDREKGRLGLLYNRRTAVEGPVEARLRQAVEAAEAAAELLEREPEFEGNLVFDRNSWEVAVNDRALAPNTENTWTTLAPVIQSVFDAMMGAGNYRLQHHANQRELFRVTVVRR
ncbi:MAG: hypothetical protein C5B51_22170 [Terriglobia bacterium]|nr:MAG: hypothetical protein C5B51_22170 [Terriglobia bacterium]